MKIVECELCLKGVAEGGLHLCEPLSAAERKQAQKIASLHLELESSQTECRCVACVERGVNQPKPKPRTI